MAEAVAHCRFHNIESCPFQAHLTILVDSEFTRLRGTDLYSEAEDPMPRSGFVLADPVAPQRAEAA